MAEKISVLSLNPPEKDGMMTKQGGSHPNWKKRYFILKGNTLYYFKSTKDADITGKIDLKDATSKAHEKFEAKKKRKVIAIPTPERTYLMYPDKDEEMQSWIDVFNKKIDALQGKTSAPPTNDTPKPPPSVTETKPDTKPTTTPVTTTALTSTDFSTPPRDRIAKAKKVVPFLQDDDSKVNEFWQIWLESIPSVEDMVGAATSIEFHVAVSSDMQKLTWRTAGPQDKFIQKMVDFFWNVGAPESEIDRLNDVGALINPLKIGSWIDMSAKGGMDGGWYFPVEIALKLALEAADVGDPTKQVQEWADANDVGRCYSVGRDMGAAPPRQTEIRLRLPGADFSSQLRVALEAFSFFGFPAIPDDALAIIRNSPPPNTPPAGFPPIDGLTTTAASSSGPSNSCGLALSVITSSEGFVRLGLLVPFPTRDMVKAMCSSSIASSAALPNVSSAVENLFKFENSLGVPGPAFAEYQYLNKNFGYGVYKEGYDVVFHYAVGEDLPK